jgi:hypothetical protein
MGAVIRVETGIKTIASVHNQCRRWVGNLKGSCRAMLGRFISRGGPDRPCGARCGTARNVLSFGLADACTNHLSPRPDLFTWSYFWGEPGFTPHQVRGRLFPDPPTRRTRASPPSSARLQPLPHVAGRRPGQPDGRSEAAAPEAEVEAGLEGAEVHAIQG